VITVAGLSEAGRSSEVLDLGHSEKIQRNKKTASTLGKCGLKSTYKMLLPDYRFPKEASFRTLIHVEAGLSQLAL
jgi:hypothetical protein